MGGPRWPPYTPSGQRYAHLNARPLSVGHGLRTQICAFWTRFLPKLLNATGMGSLWGLYGVFMG